MKICLYLEFYHFLGGILFRNIGTGLLSSYKNQKRMLTALQIPFVEQWDNSCDILQINTPWLKSLYLIKKAKRRGKKVIIWSHVTVEDAMQVFRFMPFFAPLFKKYLIYAYGLADIVFCPSEYTKSLLKNYGLPEEGLMVQSNAVDLGAFYHNGEKRNSGRAKFKLDKFTVGTVALVIPRKGIDTFLYLAKKFPDTQFPWFGAIYSSVLVKSLPKNLPTNVLFTDYVDDVLEAYNTIDVFIFPSYEENQGMAILEAAAVGLPLLVRDIPVYNGWLVHGENCLKAKTNEEFAECVRMLQSDSQLQEKLSRNAKVLAEKESVETLSKSLMETYQKLISQQVY